MSAMRVVYYVEVGACDENLAGAVRQALAKRLRQTVGPDTHVQVTMDFLCADTLDDLAVKEPATTEVAAADGPDEASRVLEAFRLQRRHRERKDLGAE